jgi:hypothetical protein
MKLIEGNLYKTRAGDKVRAIFVSVDALTYPAKMEFVNKYESSFWVSAHGNYFAQSTKMSELDIVSEA